MSCPAYRTDGLRAHRCLGNRQPDEESGPSGGTAPEDSERGFRLDELSDGRRYPAEPRALVERRHAGERRAHRGPEVGDARAELPCRLPGGRSEATAGGGAEGPSIEAGRPARSRAESAAADVPRHPSADGANRYHDGQRGRSPEASAHLGVEAARPAAETRQPELH